MMDADAINPVADPFKCSCGRFLQVGVNYCDACGTPVTYTGVTTRMLPPPATGATTRLRPPVIMTDPSEELAQLLATLHERMVVYSSDGKRLGKIRGIYVRERDLYLHVASESALWKPMRGTVGLYLPGTAIAEVSAKLMRLNLDATNANGCTSCPSWIPLAIRPDPMGGFSGA